MHYPWWYVPYLTAPMLIAVISVLHVLVSHYAVGGGIFLAVETSHAYRTGDRDYLDYLHGHARFFVLLTVVFGAITGVGIWWTIGLSSPLATEVLIRTFVFGWATEWAFFIVELTAAFIFLYYWGRLAERTHAAIGWIYAVAAWISLVLITGITAFMLNVGDWASDPNEPNFWTAFMNPQFLPQTIARTGGALLLSSLYIYLHASLTLRGKKGDRLLPMIALRAARPAMLGMGLVAAGGIGWFCVLPPAAAATLKAAAVMNVFAALVLALTVVVFALLYIGPYRNPGWLSPGFAASLCLFGFAAFATSEFIREGVRKPFVIHKTVLGNQVLADEVPNLQKKGYLESGVWTKAYVAEHFPKAVAEDDQGLYIDYDNLLKLSPRDRIGLGRVLFMHHCNDCHAAELGYSAAGLLMQGRPRSAVRDLVLKLDEANYSMPPWCGTAEEAELLTDYLMTISEPRPAGTRPWQKHADYGDSSMDSSMEGM